MSDAAAQAPASKPARAPRGRLFRRYALWFALLITGALLVSGAIEVTFSYQEHKQALVRVQQEKAAGASALVSQFINEIEAQVGWSLHSAFVPGEAGAKQRRLDFIRLLRQVPAVTELSYLDGDGREQLRVSRLSIDMEGSKEDLSQEPKFVQARERGLYLSPVYFHKESEPHLTMALAGAGRSPGVTAAEVNLKFIWDLVSQMQVGEAGRAYVVDADNRLIAHPDISLVLRKIDLSDLPHVRAARAAASDGVPAAAGQELSLDPEGREVLSAHAFIAPLGWLVFVDLPVSEAFGPVIASLERTGAIVLLGIAFSVVIGLALGRRMTGPIRLLREGAARIGGGDLTRRIEIKTGDELEAMADEFNAMATRLSESYSMLEQRVEDRTAELSGALGKLEALAEVAEAVNSSLDLQTVLSTILSHACQLSDTGGGAVYVFDEASQSFRLEAGYGMSDEMVDEIRKFRIELGETIVGECAERREAVQVADIDALTDFPLHDALKKAGVCSMLAVPLLHKDRVIGALIVRRRAAGAFAAETIDLLEAFASQSTLAIHNARLFREIEEKSHELELANQHKSQFLANMRHELRTPLNAILGYTELVQDGIYGAPGEKIGAVLGRVHTNGKDLLGLINDVLDLSKIETGQLKLSLNGYAFSDVVQTVVTATESLAADKQLAIDVEVPNDLPLGQGDERRIVQVLLNLVGNAIKFTDRGKVVISVAASDDAFHVAVSDTGPGIEQEQLEQIFSEFQQVDSSSTREKGGTGLGLTIAKRFVEMHNGRIWAESEVGQGSTFHFTVPVLMQEVEDTA